jgi:hypothetical protein
MLHDVSHVRHGDSSADAPAAGQLARQQAITQIERRRRFMIGAVTGAVVMIVLVVIWAGYGRKPITEAEIENEVERHGRQVPRAGN